MQMFNHQLTSYSNNQVAYVSTLEKEFQVDPELTTMYTRLIRLGLSVDEMEYNYGVYHSTYYAPFNDILEGYKFVIQFSIQDHQYDGVDWRPLAYNIDNISHIEVSYTSTVNGSGKMFVLYHRDDDFESHTMKHVAKATLTSYNKSDIAAELADFIEDYL